MSARGSRQPLPCCTVLLLVGLLLVGALLAVGCGGGGDVVDDGEPIPLSEYRFAVIGQDGGLIVSFDEGILGLDPDPARGPGITGRYTVATETVRVSAGSFFEILDTMDAIFGNLDVSVIEDIVFPADGEPTAGRWEVTDGEDVIVVRAVTAPAGVQVSLNGGAETYVDWDTFFDALGGGASLPEHVVVGSLGIGALRAVLELMGVVIESFDRIDVDLQATNPLTVGGSGFAPGHTVPADIVLDPGRFDFYWIDGFANGEVGPGDSFSWVFFDYWLDDPFTAPNPWYQGRIELWGYTEVLDANDRLVRIGFEPFGGLGGVSFEDLQLGEVWFEDGEGRLETNTTWNGTVTIVFFE